MVFWPFVRGLQWGAYVTCHSPCRGASLILPLPEDGSSDIVVAILKQPLPGPFTVGQALPNNTAALSNSIEVQVQVRAREHRRADPPMLVGMEWEPWFTRTNDIWTLAEAVPLVGLYDSFNPLVVLQHAYWMVDAGVDFIVVDWTNNLWGVPHWADRGVYAQELINATTFTIAQYDRLRRAGVPVPKVVLLLGLDNGAAEPVGCLMEEV